MSLSLGVILMVKNEEQTIERSLRSSLEIANKIIILDTGSTDNTVIKAGLYLQNNNIPYHIYNEPFVNFAVSRNRLLELTRLNHPELDYVLMLDADDVIRYNESFYNQWISDFGQHDFINITHQYRFTTYYLPKLLRNSIKWRYIGATHEYLDTQGFIGGFNKDIYIEQFNDGHRRRTGNKFKNDSELLERQTTPSSRDVFYLAESYRADCQYEKAIDKYFQRTLMGGWEEEIFYSYYMLGRLHEVINSDELIVATNYWKAYEICPNRIEPLWHLYFYWDKKGYKHLQRYIIPKIRAIKKPSSGLFLEEDKYVISNLLQTGKD
jgi:glycosyltransferase involved in cell wall biosynthesis